MEFLKANWHWFLVAGAGLIAAIVAGAEYLDAATSMLPGV